MKSNIMLIIALLSLALIVGACSTGTTQNQNPGTGTGSGTGTGTTTGASSTVTSAELAKHNSGSDCWVGFQGKVYDLTDFLPIHPGSPGAIIPYCGTSTEFEQAFTQKHSMRHVQLLMDQGILKGSLA